MSANKLQQAAQEELRRSPDWFDDTLAWIAHDERADALMQAALGSGDRAALLQMADDIDATPRRTFLDNFRLIQRAAVLRQMAETLTPQESR